jgi:hypothetical protein
MEERNMITKRNQKGIVLRKLKSVRFLAVVALKGTVSGERLWRKAEIEEKYASSGPQEEKNLRHRPSVSDEVLDHPGTQDSPAAKAHDRQPGHSPLLFGNQAVEVERGTT